MFLICLITAQQYSLFIAILPNILQQNHRTSGTRSCRCFSVLLVTRLTQLISFKMVSITKPTQLQSKYMIDQCTCDKVLWHDDQHFCLLWHSPSLTIRGGSKLWDLCFSFQIVVLHLLGHYLIMTLFLAPLSFIFSQ